ncbi:MAG TPA: hypothetical protein VN451_05360, partial [Chitinophagaceae bacterium]|nr:hypothetical protein [Chitinophagaceae bacterium]
MLYSNKFALAVILLGSSLCSNSQSVRKIEVQDVLHPVFYAITPDDIAFGGDDFPSGDKKFIGYRYRRANSNVVMGML